MSDRRRSEELGESEAKPNEGVTSRSMASVTILNQFTISTLENLTSTAFVTS
jgi:hypothetical protein